METIKLTTITVVRRSEERQLTEGIEIAYYGNKNENFENPWIGETKKDEGGFYIKWDDGSDDTRIDGSVDSIRVLKNCGFF